MQTATQDVYDLVPFVHVADVEASLAFYAMLGFGTEQILKDGHGRAFWARARSGKGQIMFSQADSAVDAGQQAVLFYMYSADVAALRRQLLASGLHNGGTYRGGEAPNGGRRVVYEVAHPFYMKAGEVRVVDPDGYVILVGQME